MAIVVIDSSELELKKFEIRCLKCGSLNTELEIDWASYPSASWNTTKLICKDCNEDEVCFETL